MSNSFNFNAPHYVDFSNGWEANESEEIEEYFEFDHENQSAEIVNVKYIDSDERELEQEFFSYEEVQPEMSNSEKCVQNRLTRSISMGNLLPRNEVIQKNGETKTSSPEQIKTDGEGRRNVPCNLKRSFSKDHINKLALPKCTETSTKAECRKFVSVAEAVRKFQRSTPVRFHSKPQNTVRENRDTAKIFPITKPQSPALATKQRSRPTFVLSAEERERIAFEEAKKYKIKARPVNQKIMRGPVCPKVPVEKKCNTVLQPFNLTEMRLKENMLQKADKFEFHARPLPKSIFNPPKPIAKSGKVTDAITPTFCRRRGSKENIRPDLKEKQPTVEASKPVRLTRTFPVPFSFEKRDKDIEKKKEELLNKVREQEKKTREFHARPMPKRMFTSPQPKQNCTVSTNNKSAENICDATTFKARPAKVLYMKPFEPKRSERSSVEIIEFQLNTQRRAKEREAFDGKLKEKDEMIAGLRRRKEEERALLEQKEVARLRKEAEHKANPIRHFKEIKAVPSKRLTEPVSPRFMYEDRLKKKAATSSESL